MPNSVLTPLPGQTAEIRGLAYDNLNGTMYGITAQGVLVSVNLGSGTTIPLLVLPLYPQGSIQNEWSGLAFDATTDSLYAANAFGNNEMVDIRLPSLTETTKGSTDFGSIPLQILGLAFSGAGGVLYGGDRSNDNIVTISTANAAVAFTYGGATDGVPNLQEITFDPDSGTLYAVFDHGASSDDAALGTYNFTTDKATVLGDLPFQIDFNGVDGNSTYGAGGMAFGPAAVPEPGSLLLLGTGLVVLLGGLSARRRGGSGQIARSMGAGRIH